MLRKRIRVLLLCVSLWISQTTPFVYASEMTAESAEMLIPQTEVSTEAGTEKEEISLKAPADTENAVTVILPETENGQEEETTREETQSQETEIVESIPETEPESKPETETDSLEERPQVLTVDAGSTEETEKLKDEKPINAGTTLEDGTYPVEAFSYEGGTGKLKLTCSEILVKQGKAYAKVGISSTNITEVQWAGGSFADAGGIRELEIPVRLNTANTISLKSVAMSTPHYIRYTITPILTEPEGEPESETQEESEPETERETESEPISETETEPITETETPGQDAKPSGKYFDKNGNLKKGEYTLHNVELAEGYRMFNIVSCTVKSARGKVTATLTLHGTGYDYLYPGTKEEALKAAKKDLIPFSVDKDGYYTYTIPIEAFDRVVVISARSKRYAEMGAEQPWYEKGLIFHSSSLQKNGDEYEPPETEKETEKQTEKQTDAYPENTGGTTPAVNNETHLADGTYTPDSFGYSGGTGRLSISCSSITVSGGKAYAMLVFSSGSIIYVKANGQKYGPSSKDSVSSCYQIPVQLNGNTKILACTTAMSKPHEVAYTISIGLKAAQKADQSAGETEALEESAQKAGISEEKFERREDAPEILGLTYTGSFKPEEAQYFRLHYYDKGFKVLELYTGTQENAIWKKTETQNTDETEKTDPENTDSEEEPALYEDTVLQYLIYPKDSELPAGIEKDMILIPMEPEIVFCASEEAKKMLQLVGKEQGILSQEECGAYDSDDLFLNLLLNGVDLAIVPSDICQEEGKVAKIGDDLQLLEIPMIVDRSDDEKNEQASKEWKQVYAALLGAEEMIRNEE